MISTGRPKLEARGVDSAPLSFAQLRLWFLERLQGETTEYNAVGALRFNGPLDPTLLARSIEAITDRHSALRTTFTLSADGEPMQVIAGSTVACTFEDWREGQDDSQRLHRAIEEEWARPFDLSTGPLLRARVLRLSDDEHVLLYAFHHIVCDAWSHGTFLFELLTFYGSLRDGVAAPLRPLRVQYIDFALWQRQWLDESVIQRGLAYWRQQLAGAPARLELPCDPPRRSVRTFEAEAVFVSLTEPQLAPMRAVCRSTGTTPYMVFLAALAVLLQRHTSQGDIVIGSPSANRPHPDLEPLIGFFVNSLPMRVRVTPNVRLRDLLKQVRGTAVSAFVHQEIPFERVVQEIAPSRLLDSTPVFQVVLAVQNAPLPRRGLDGITVDEIRQPGILRVRYDLEVHVRDAGDRTEVIWYFPRQLFSRDRVAAWARRFSNLVANLDPDRTVGELPMLTDAEREAILTGFNATASPIREATVRDLLEEQATRTPDAVAIVRDRDVVSYGCLHSRSDALVRQLIRRGVGPDDIVAIAIDRSVSAVIAIVATLKAGSAYLPLEPSDPDHRLDTLMAGAKPVLVLTTHALARRFEASGRPVLVVDGQASQSSHGAAQPTSVPPLHRSHLAYVMHTSGSTGAPKGVAIAHSSVVNLLASLAEMFLFRAGDRVLHKTPLSFDVSIWEILLPLSRGGTIVLAAPGAHRYADYLADTISEHQVTIVHFVPSMLRGIVDTTQLPACKSLRLIACGGEALSADLHGRLTRILDVSVFHLYGPTECTVDATGGLASSEQGRNGHRPTSMGAPLRNVKAYVLGPDMQPVPIGTPGELYVSGAGLARGYFRHTSMTAARFVANPYEHACRMYRTGDLVEWCADGRLEFVGRADHQVKVRGFRIELAEIEHVLKTHPEVSAAVVAAPVVDGDRRLVAYIVASDRDRDTRATESQIPSSDLIPRLNAFVRTRVPEAMVPNAIVLLDALPTTTSGKVDRAALPLPVWTDAAPWHEPRTELERAVCAVFAEVLGVTRVGLDDNFFNLGGHSIAAVRVVARLAAHVGRDVRVRTLFEAPSPRQLAEAVAPRGPAVDPMAVRAASSSSGAVRAT